jgi:uncharacterized protein DUF5047
MIPVSERWPLTVQSSHDIVSRVEVRLGSEVLVEDLPIVSGTVTRDYGSTITLSAEVEVGDPVYLPKDYESPVSPYGSSLRIWSGIKYPDQVRELLLLFDGPITGTPSWATQDKSFTVKAEGWLRHVADDRFTEPYAPAAGTSVRAAIDGLLLGSVPGASVTYAANVGTGSTREGQVWEEDRLQAVSDLAQSIGGVVRESPGGGFVVERDLEPDPLAEPVREFIHGDRGVMLSGTAPEFSREERYNGVVAWNPDDPTVRALATISDPLNPVRWGGPFGRKVLYYSSPLLTSGTVLQAAQTRLDGLQGRIRKIDASVLPDQSIEPGDHVRIVWPPNYGTFESMDELAMVRKVVHPLGPGATTLELRGTG